jgi:hypothetical protein
MATQFVKYTPEVEAVDPQFDEKMRSVVEATERYVADSVTDEGIGRAVRDAHATGYGLVRGEVEKRSRSSTGSPPSMRRVSTQRPGGTTRSPASPTARPTPGPMPGLAPRSGWG